MRLPKFLSSAWKLIPSILAVQASIAPTTTVHSNPMSNVTISNGMSALMFPQYPADFKTNFMSSVQLKYELNGKFSI